MPILDPFSPPDGPLVSRAHWHRIGTGGTVFTVSGGLLKADGVAWDGGGETGVSPSIVGDSFGDVGVVFWNDLVPATADMLVELTIPDTRAAQYGVGGRIDPATGHGYYAVMDCAYPPGGSPTYQGIPKLYVVTGFSRSLLFTGGSLVQPGDTIGIKLCGTTIQYLVNGAAIGTVTSSIITAAGRAGIVCGGPTNNYGWDTFPQDATIYEDFSYSDGPLTGNGGWIDFAAAPVIQTFDVASGATVYSPGGFDYRGNRDMASPILTDVDIVADFPTDATYGVGTRVQDDGSGLYLMRYINGGGWGWAATQLIYSPGFSTLVITWRGPLFAVPDYPGVTRWGMRVKQLDATTVDVTVYPYGTLTPCGIHSVIEDSTSGPLGIFGNDGGVIDNIVYSEYTGDGTVVGGADNFAAEWDPAIVACPTYNPRVNLISSFTTV